MLLPVLILSTVLFFSSSVSCSDSQPCNPYTAGTEFKKKVDTSPYPEYTKSPYFDLTDDLLVEIKKANADKERVCAIQYEDEYKVQYHLKQFKSKQEADDAGYIVTH